MNYFLKNKVMFWALVVLIVINITALAGFFIFMGKAPATPGRGQGEGRGMAFRKELGLTADQSGAVAVINDKYRQVAAPLSAAVRDLRAGIFTELDREKPDTLLVDSLALQVIRLQQQLQKASIRQYLALKQVCTYEQAKKLSALYRDLYGFQAQKGQMQHRYKYGRERK